MNKIFLLISITFLISTLTSCSSEDAVVATAAATSSQMGGTFQGVELSLSTAVTTLAGTGSSGSTNGTGTAASFKEPAGITTDGTNLYVAESNHMIRKIVISTGVVTTVAGSTTSGSANGTGTAASFDRPAYLTTDGTTLFVSDYNNHMIRQID